MPEYQELINIFNGRAAFYEYFTSAFHEPAPEEFLKLSAGFLPYFVNMAEDIDTSEFRQSVSEFKSFMETDANKPGIIDELNRSFTSLFLLGDRSIPTMESVYTSEASLTRQESWVDAMRMYGDHGFGVPVEMNRSEEDVSSELLFMYFLSKKTAVSLESKDEDDAVELISAQARFMDKHLIGWVPELCDRVINGGYENIFLYKSLAGLLRGFLFYDKALLDEIVAEIKA